MADSHSPAKAGGQIDGFPQRMEGDMPYPILYSHNVRWILPGTYFGTYFMKI